MDKATCSGVIGNSQSGIPVYIIPAYCLVVASMMFERDFRLS